MFSDTPDPLEDIPIAPFLEKAFPNDPWKEWVDTLRQAGFNTAADWGGRLDEEITKLIKAGVPGFVSDNLDKWFEQQLGKWNVVAPPDINVEVICREDTKQQLVDYSFGCVAEPPTDRTSNGVWCGGGGDGKCILMCTSGIMGIGKTTVLSKVWVWVQERVDNLNEAAATVVPACGTTAPPVAVDVPASTASHSVPNALLGFKMVSLSYSGGCGNFPIPPEGGEGLCFGQHLLRSYHFPDQWMGKVRSLKHALWFMRTALELDDTKLLIITVDEMAELHRMCGTAGDRVLEATVTQLMGFQDFSLMSKKQPTVFIFSSILEKFFRMNGRRTGFGRAVQAMTLHNLNLQQAHDLLFENKRGLREAAAKSSALYQLILSCMGHPRALLEGIPEMVSVERTNTSAVAGYRAKILTMCKLDALQYEPGEVVEKWFCCSLSPEESELLVIRGALHRVDGIPFILPLMLHDWAARTAANRLHPRRKLAHHLCEADADCAEATHEKKVEDVVMHYEAVRRFCLTQRSGVETLRSFYTTKLIGPGWKDRKVKIKIPGHFHGEDGVVRYVKDFTDVKEVVQHLRDGFIVASEKSTERGLEYASPFFDAQDESKVLVAVVQVNFVQEHYGEDLAEACALEEDEYGNDRGEVEDDGNHEQEEQHTTKHTPNVFTQKLDVMGIEWFPVAYTTHHRETASELNGDTYSDGVYFTGMSLFEFTRPLGILRMHLEKLGRHLQHRCPTLARPPATKRGRNGCQLEVDE